MTEEEGNDLATVDPVKVRQVLARATNEILAGITVPLRRLKLEDSERFKERLEKITDQAERAAAMEE